MSSSDEGGMPGSFIASPSVYTSEQSQYQQRPPRRSHHPSSSYSPTAGQGDSSFPSSSSSSNRHRTRIPSSSSRSPMQDYNNAAAAGESGTGRQSYRASLDQSYDPSSSSSPAEGAGQQQQQQHAVQFVRGGQDYAPARGMSTVAPIQNVGGGGPVPVHQGSGSSSLSNSSNSNSASMSGMSANGSGSGWHSSSADPGAWNGAAQQQQQQQQRSGSGGGTPRLDTQLGGAAGAGVAGVGLSASSPAKRSSAFGGLPAQQYSNGGGSGGRGGIVAAKNSDLVASPISSDGHSSRRRMETDAAAVAGNGNAEAAGRSVMAATSSYSALPRPAGQDAQMQRASPANAATANAAALNGGDTSISNAVVTAVGGAGAAGVGGGASASMVKERKRDQACAACGKQMTGQFVRALGTVYHLDCFRCRDCGKVVASKFFPATDDMIDNHGDAPGQLFALCETDYFRRLNLLCAKCGGALRGSYITALGMKFHVEHFTCSICPTVFGPQDSYYEHDGKVFCHFHYSTRFAIPCTGCRTAILKQFVEINRNNVDEHWHPECYMIHKFWNIKLCPTGMTPREGVAIEPTANPSEPNPSNSGVAPVSSASADAAPSADALELEAKETPVSLKQKQKLMEERVYRIWTVLSAFEESSAACISEMLKDVSSGRYLGGVKMAEKFILHVEVLFSAIDALEAEFRKAQVKGISHIREARMLCKKIVNFFSLLSHTQETGARRMGITQELLSLVTGMAHYLKILIRIALSGALKLDREHSNPIAIIAFLDQLASLAKEGMRETPVETGSEVETLTYGYSSLPRSTTTSSRLGEAGEMATDLCVGCGQTVEEECLRMGINTRWHASCFRCHKCQRPTTNWTPKKIASGTTESASTQTIEGAPSALPPVEFSVESVRHPFDPTIPGASTRPTTTHTPYCPTCATQGSRRGLETVSRLEQYAFLLRVALNRLYALLKKRGVVPPSPPVVDSAQLSVDDRYSDEGMRDSSDIKRMRSVNLDRKLSTKAKVPHISTVVGSPSGRQTDTQAMSPIEPGQNRISRRSPSPQHADPRMQQTQAHRPPAPHRRSSRDLSPNPNDPSQGPFGRAASPGRKGAGSIIPIRPAFARHNTDVRIREDGPVRQSSGDEAKRRLGTAEDGITLADIPQLLEVEQAREQHRTLADGRRPFSELSALELFIVKHMAVMVLQQSALKDLVPLDDLIEFIETRKNTFWGKLFKGGKDKKEIKKKGVFGIPLEILVERSGADSTLGASAGHLRVPSFIDDIISTMKQMDVSVEGIFRKNGNIRRLKDLSEALDRDSAQVNLSDDNPVQLAALLKKFLRELPDPLMTFKLHRLFVSSQMLEPEPERMRILHMVTVLLPKAHRDTLEILFVFLKWVASFSHIDEETGSKMDLTNLATVLAPNILYSKGPNPAKDETFLANRAVLSILENQESFWTVPAELEAVLQDRDFIHQSADMTSRDILKRCEKHALHQKQSANRLRSDYHPGIGPAGPNGRPPMRPQQQQGPAHMLPPQQQQQQQPLPPLPSQAQPQQGPYGNPEAPQQYAPIASRN